MKVCHFCETSVEGAYFKHIAKGLTENGVQVSLIELGSHKPPAWLKDIPGVKYFNLGVTSKLQYPLAVWRLARLLKREKIDVLQTHLYYSGLISVLAKRLHRKTVFVLTRHHTAVVRMLGSKAHIFLDKWMAEKTDFVTTVSHAARKYMEEVDGIRQRVEVVYTGFDFEKLAPNEDERKRIRREFGFGENDFVVGYIGNFAPGKGHLQLIEAFSKIISDVRDGRLFIVGRGNLAEVDEAVERFSLREKIVFAGWRDDAAACLNAMDLFVQPSLSEAFSQVLIEAMGVGLPVIATNVGGASEVVTDGENGFLIEPNDTEAIHQKTLEIYRSPELKRKIALAGRKSVREKFTIEQMIDRQFELYKQWLNK
jgi:glycosyltransferase involved in cell wall biosynthesis